MCKCKAFYIKSRNDVCLPIIHLEGANGRNICDWGFVYLLTAKMEEVGKDVEWKPIK